MARFNPSKGRAVSHPSKWKSFEALLDNLQNDSMLTHVTNDYVCILYVKYFLSEEQREKEASS